MVALDCVCFCVLVYVLRVFAYTCVYLRVVVCIDVCSGSCMFVCGCLR